MFHFLRKPQLAGHSTAMGSADPALAHLHRIEFALVLASFLSLAWLIADAAQSPQAFGVSTEWNCLGFGRAGGHCVKTSPAKNTSCLMGRGGEVCPLVAPSDRAPR